MFICIYAISVFPVVSIDLFIKPQSDLSKAERNVYNEAWKRLNKNKNDIAKDVRKEWAKGLGGKMFVCICAIFASPVICVGLFIESYVELIKAACNFYNANMKVFEKRPH